MRSRNTFHARKRPEGGLLVLDRYWLAAASSPVSFSGFATPPIGGIEFSWSLLTCRSGNANFPKLELELDGQFRGRFEDDVFG